MSWLSQNWIWILLAVAVAWFAMRRGFGAQGGHIGGHGAGGLLGGMGHGGHGYGGHDGHDREQGGEPAQTAQESNAPEAAIDPVSGEAVRTQHALTSIYQGKIYYFSSKDNRERFEAAPQDYAHKAAGQPLQAPERAESRPRRRGGC